MLLLEQAEVLHILYAHVHTHREKENALALRLLIQLLLLQSKETADAAKNQLLL